MSYGTSFSKNLATLIDSYGLTIRELAGKTDIPISTLHRYKTSNVLPDVKNAVVLAEYFGVSLDWMVGLSANQFPSLADDERKLLKLYKRASNADRTAIQAMLSKYEAEDE